MRWHDVIDHVAGKTGLPKPMARVASRAVFAALSDAVHNHERVAVPEFGAFSVARRSGRKVRHPRTGDLLHIRARHVPVFKPFRRLSQSARSRSAR